MKKLLFCALCLALGKLAAQQSIDAYITSADSNKFVQIASSANAVTTPVDLDFYPNQDSRPMELWILNQGTYNSGGHSVIISRANSGNRSHRTVVDGNAWHFMAMASSMAFGDSNWATSQDIQDANRSGGVFTGPTLWPGNLKIYGIMGNPASSLMNGSHLDMIHQSPYGKGIAFERNNVYWIMDGYDGTLKRYDFAEDHGPGQHYHGDGGVRVYNEFKFTRHATLPAHIAFDWDKKYLYGCDPVGKRVFRLDATTGTKGKALSELNPENLALGYFEYKGATLSDSLIKGLNAPVGVDVYGKRLIVSDNGSDEIIIFDISDNFKELGRIALDYTSDPDPMGLRVGPDGKIYFTDYANKSVYMIENSQVQALRLAESPKVDFRLYPNPAKSSVQLQWNANAGVNKVVVTNLIGEVVLEHHVEKQSSTTLDVSNLVRGMYFVAVVSGNDRQVQKLILE